MNKTIEAMKLPVEIRQIDAWEYEEGVWTWNDSTVLDHTFFWAMLLWTDQFRHWLDTHGMGDYCDNPDYYFEMVDGAVLELRRKDNDRPLIAACITFD